MIGIDVILSCCAPLVLILLGLIVGSSVEAGHLRRLAEREADLLRTPLTDLKTVPPGLAATPRDAVLVTGSVVVATDYFKTFAAGLKKLVGGEIRSFERLMERGRREAICRMMTEARARGAVAVINVRLETSNIGAVARNPAPMVEVVAYGTAVLG